MSERWDGAERRLRPPHPDCPFNELVWQERLDGLDEKLKELVDLVRAQNGRVTRLEMAAAVDAAREEEREKARKEASRIAAETAKRAATTRATLISVAGLLLSALTAFLGR